MASTSFNQTLKIALTFGLTTASAVCAPAAFAGSLVLVGGSWGYPGLGGPEESYGVSIYEKVVDLAGGVENAKIGIFSTASGRPQNAANLYIGDLRTIYGDAISVEWIPVVYDEETGQCATSGDDATIINQINSSNAFIFTGGDQSYISSCFFDEDPVAATRADTGIIEAVRNQFANGAVIAGTSAGTAVQPSAPMITSGESYESLTNGTTSFIGSPPSDREVYYNPLGGLGFFEYGLLDSHFSERGRQGRIIRLASDVGVDMAYGIDENTALVVTNTNTPDVNFEVLGQGGVFIADLSEAEVGDKNGYWTIDGVKATYLTEGDQFDPLTKTATFAGTNIAGQEELDEVPDNTNIFSYFDEELDDGFGDWTDPRSFTNTAIDLFNSDETEASGVSLEKDPVQYGVTLTKGPGATGYRGTDSLGKTTYSYSNLTVAIAPVPEPTTVLGLLGMGAWGASSLLKRKR